MRINGKKRLVTFMQKHGNSVSSLETWVQIAEKAEWKTPMEIKRDFVSASFLSNNRVVFNIGGNNFRLVVIVVYIQNAMIVSWIGTHAEYDRLKL